METFELYQLINQKRWTEFLKALEIGKQTFALPSIDDIKSCVSVAYRLNSDRLSRFYSINADKNEKKITITVIAR